jgi:hypothetical protein
LAAWKTDVVNHDGSQNKNMTINNESGLYSYAEQTA